MLNSKSIGQKIALGRKQLNVSQAQLAEKLFISPQAVGKWERGESLPDLITFQRLSELFNVDLNYFTGNQPPTPIQKEKGKKHGWNMSEGNWVDADFSGLSRLQDKLNRSNLKNSKFIQANLSQLELKENHVEGCDFTRANLSESQFKSAHLSENNFSNTLLVETHFNSCHIGHCNFDLADLSCAEFQSSVLTHCSTNQTVWKGTRFVHSQLHQMTFTGHIIDCYFERCSFSKVLFKNAHLSNTFFKNRSLKRIQFEDCTVDKITYEFLKNGKAKLEGITMMTD